MDITELAEQITARLAPAMPYLPQAGDKAVAEAGEGLGAEARAVATDLWPRLRPKVAGKPAAADALEDWMSDADDPDARASFRRQIRKILVDDADLASELTRLLAAMRPPPSYAAQANDQGVIAQDQSVAAHMVAVGRDVQGNVIIINGNASRVDPDKLLRAITRRPPEPELTRATASYLDFLVDRYRYLDFRGMGISDRVPLQLALLEMYVPLEARVGTPRGETWARELRLAGRQVSEKEAQAMGQWVSAPQPVLHLLKAHDGLIVLGDPGAGKTTFLKFLALSLATGQGEPLGLGTRLPVLAPLSAYATALAGRRRNVPLDRFISKYHKERGVTFPIDAMLAQALEKGGALLLLDGLDEVKDPGQRRRVVDLVTDFFSVHRKAGNKFVITSRVVGYGEVRPQVEGLAECTLVDLEDGQIEDFVGKWTAALERAARGQTRVAVFEAEQERDELLTAIHRNPGVRALAVNPLLLTILALMKRQGITLPERRVQLYEKYVGTLLKHWNLARSLLAGRVGRDLDVMETLRILAPLALWMHRTSPGVGLVPRAKLQQELKDIYRTRSQRDPEKAAREFLDDVRDHAGLLLDRGGQQFGFIHLTFQEYLAGVALAQKGQQGVGPIVDELADHVTDDTWREVSLLAIGYLGIVQGRDEAAGAVLDKLIERAPGEPGAAVILAGEAVADVGAGGVRPESRQRVIEALFQALGDDRRVKAERRAIAGRVLAACGDPRPEVMTVDGMTFCWVPAGSFLLGSDSDPDAVKSEKPQQEYDIPYDYWMARFPVTVAQFRAYVQASGEQPGDPDALKGIDNHPVIWVNWHEAQAFCRWLTQRWREWGLLPQKWAVQLPSEPEWEKAARGGLRIPAKPLVGRVALEPLSIPLTENPKPARRYPWGDEPNPNFANYGDSGVGDTSSAGCFPGSASPCGCLDMAGNVWEWTRSLWGEDWEKARFSYPYDPTDGREDLEAPDNVLRVLRGGAFYFAAWGARCAYRGHFVPDLRLYHGGFRVVVSPFFSGR